MSAPHTRNILAISGSLRANSSNNAVLAAAARFFPNNVNITTYEGIGNLPHFNDSMSPSKEVIDFRDRLRAADGVLICSPEYAFGVPGTLKNALDWTVASAEFVNKPVALITAATGGNNAHAALLLIFKALSANVYPDATLLISFIRSRLSVTGEVTDSLTLDAIRKVVESFMKVIENANK
jgi:chromate reductase